MGCYDIVVVKCPNCGEPSECQSKGGEDLMRIYHLGVDVIPDDVISDVNRHSPVTCLGCGTLFAVDVELIPYVSLEIKFKSKAEVVKWPHHRPLNPPAYDEDALELAGWPPDAMRNPCLCKYCDHWNLNLIGRKGWGMCALAYYVADGSRSMIITDHGEEEGVIANLQTNENFGCLKFEPK